MTTNMTVSAPVKRGRGRPPRADKAATERLDIRITAAERAAWIRVARGRPLSDWVRSLANDAAILGVSDLGLATASRRKVKR